MPRLTPFAISLLLTWITTTQAAANDWTKPCFSGSCSYDVAPSSQSAAASLQIWSTNNSSISDITEAAGWIVLGCNNSTTQDIRLVCNSDDADASGCNHLYQSGAEDTIVRLPASVSTITCHWKSVPTIFISVRHSVRACDSRKNR